MSTKSTDQKGGSFSFLPMDLSGKLIIKARLGDDIRRVPIHNEDITYDELLLMLQRVFRGKLNNTDDVTLKYCDEDGDLITVVDSSDLNIAKQISRLLKITIFIHGKEPLPTLDASEVQEVRQELIAIRDKVNALLDAIDGKPKASEVEPSQSSNQLSRVAAAESMTKPAAGAEVNKPVVTGSITMFDPLKPNVSASDNSTAHLFSQDSRASGDFLASSDSKQPSGYPNASQPPYSSPSPQIVQPPQQQPPPVPAQQQPPVPAQQSDPSYYVPQQQKSGYPPQHYQTPPPTSSPGPSAPSTSTYQQPQPGYNQPAGGYTVGAPPPQQPGGYNYGFQTSHPQTPAYPSKPATAYGQQQPGYAPYNSRY